MSHKQFQCDVRSFLRNVADSGSWRLAFLSALAACLTAFAPLSTMAQDQQEPAKAAPSTENGQIEVELNKLETIDTGCRIYVVVNNKSDTEFKTLKLDLVLFRTDGIVDQRFFVDLAPLRKEKRIVKLFELSKVACNDIGSFLVNDVVECRNTTESVDNCLSRMSVSSLAKAKLSK
ncbi:conserved exported protein of unknown function [Candidatus Filomicrobium marinum]|uniref:Tat pathway signal sequence domain protein n=2 Tax=Filomicrobium TaxID=119044 RepID=A0A0D6JDC1_9HYPH|nr:MULTISPECIES: hypothetical protein [Filomicrobium]MCV0368405.1 hypothetical protein [Filomicrobium sp.]CFX11112.1 conserved exported protein of unknown function [Candidatus Filomicrobium marinum]CPR17224.1 conserved exported protein of unknown function [Candidatus Filomicrobium marinum]SDO37740.1 hypothetical protein SAMN04488061_1032 [Filomicrobium insigne]